MPLPSFVIVGAMRSGTTTLASMMRRHPQVHLAAEKEVHFFDRRYDEGLDWYASRFDPTSEEIAVGEATPVYMYQDQARRRLATDLPDARLLAILRNPVDRAYSHYWHRVKAERESLPFEAALEAEPQRLLTGGLDDLADFSYVDRGHYVDQLEALSQLAGRDRVKVVLLEDLTRDTENVMKDIFRFIGVDEVFAAEIPLRTTNDYRSARMKGLARWAENRPKPLRDVITRFNTIPAEYPPMVAATRARLEAEYAPYNERLSQWLGRELAAWAPKAKAGR